MPRVRVEFTVEPFVDGRPGAHVLAAWSAVESHGAALDSGPFSSETTIDEAALDSVVGDLVKAAFSHGAARVSLQLERVES